MEAAGIIERGPEDYLKGHKVIQVTEAAPVTRPVTAGDTVSTDSGISSAISEEETDNGATSSSSGDGKKESRDPDMSDKTDISEKTAQKYPALKLEKPKLFNNKAKTYFEEVKRIAILIEKAVRQKKVFCLGGNHFPSARKALLKRGWIEVGVRSRSASGKYVRYPMYNPASASGSAMGPMAPPIAVGVGSGSGMRSEECASDININVLRENVEVFLKKDSNLKRPMKPDVIYTKLTKNFMPNHEWCGHRRRIPWKHLLKDQVVNKFPSSFFTTKTGLHQSLQHLHWYSPQPVSTFFPRCHQVHHQPTMPPFILL